MNLMSITAFLLAGSVFLIGALTSTDNPMAFVDGHAALIVFGGTIAVAAISFQIDKIFALLGVFYQRVVKNRKIDIHIVITQLLEISSLYTTNRTELREYSKKIDDYFLADCLELLLDDYLNPEELENIILLRADTIYHRYNEDAKKFKALGKFPPAMGLMGAVLGMIALLQTLGTPGAEKNVGPAMAIAMVATLYGIAFANLFILPVAENLVQGTSELRMKNIIIARGLKLVALKKNRIIMSEELNSFLLPGERKAWKESNHRAA